MSFYNTGKVKDADPNSPTFGQWVDDPRAGMPPTKTTADGKVFSRTRDMMGLQTAPEPASVPATPEDGSSMLGGSTLTKEDVQKKYYDLPSTPENDKARQILANIYQKMIEQESK